MPRSERKEIRLTLHLPLEFKELIEEAAELLGQSVGDYAVATLVHDASRVVGQRNGTELTDRDRDRLLAVLDEVEAQPNKSLRIAADQYKRHMNSD